MSDWIPAPKIENALIILMDIPDTAEEYAGFPHLDWLNQIADHGNCSPYLYHEKPDAGEVFEETLPDTASKFALLAQLPGNTYEIMFSGFRRIFSRLETKRAIVLTGGVHQFSPEEIQSAFRALDTADIILNENSDGAILLGMNSFYQEIFRNDEHDLSHLRNILEAYAKNHALNFLRI